MLKQLKLWLYLHKDDLSGFFKLFLPLILIIFIYRAMPSIVRYFQSTGLDADTIGIVDSITKNEGIHESEAGGRVIIKSYQIEYHFISENEKVARNEYLSRSSISLSQRMVLNKLDVGGSVFVRYNSGNPLECQIVFE